MTWGYHLIANLKKCRGCQSIFLGKKNDGKKIIEIKIIPKKNNIENKKFLIIFVKS